MIGIEVKAFMFVDDDTTPEQVLSKLQGMCDKHRWGICAELKLAGPNDYSKEFAPMIAALLAASVQAKEQQSDICGKGTSFAGAMNDLQAVPGGGWDDMPNVPEDGEEAY